jgi:hypothetical protein
MWDKEETKFVISNGMCSILRYIIVVLLFAKTRNVSLNAIKHKLKEGAM